MERITSTALKKVYEKVVNPVIVETTKTGFENVSAYISSFVNGSNQRTLFKQQPILSIYSQHKRIPEFNMHSAILSRERIFDLAQDPNVIKIYPDTLRYALSYPSVMDVGVYKLRNKKTNSIMTFTTTQETKHLLGLDTSNFSGAGVKTAILDTGTIKVHAQIPRFGVLHESAMPGHENTDANGHGTWCSTCIAGQYAVSQQTSNLSQKTAACVGMAPNVQLYSIKCLGHIVGSGPTSSIIEAIGKAINNKVDVMSMSLGSKSDTQKPQDDPMYKPFEHVKQNGIIPCVAAGNDGPQSNTIDSPGCFDSVLTVGAYNPIDGTIPDFSSRGPTNWNSMKPDVIAPGVSILSGSAGLLAKQEFISQRYAILSGTSMATPHVAGLVSQMMEAHRKYVGKKIITEEIKTMMSQLGSTKNMSTGWGIINWHIYKQWLSTQYGISI